MKESKNEKFKRLATQRTNSVLNSIRLIGNLSNRANYAYTEEEVNKVFSTIERELKETKVKFTYPKRREFRL